MIIYLDLRCQISKNNSHLIDTLKKLIYSSQLLLLLFSFFSWDLEDRQECPTFLLSPSAPNFKNK